MKDERYSEEEYSGIDDELLQDFENELAAEDRARRKKIIFAAAGVVIGVIVVSALAGLWGGESPEPRAVEHEQEAAKNSPEEDLDAQIAALAEKNRIDEDFRAPGALAGEEAVEPSMAEPSEGENTAAPSPEHAGQTPDTPAPAEAVVRGEEEIPLKKISGPAAASGPAKAESTSPAAPQAELVEEEAAVAGKASGQPAEPVQVASLPPVEEPKRAEERPEGDKGVYSVQLLVTTDAAQAFDLRDSLSRKGFAPWISTGKAKKSVYSVEVGEFSSIKEASGMSGSLGEAGFATRTSYKANRRVTLVAGSYDTEGPARRLAEKLSAAGFSARVENKSGPVDLYIVRSGKYRSLSEAERAEDALKRAGYNTRGVAR